MKDNSLRMHNMDALRALAMVLGVFLHAAIPYKMHPTEGWPKDMSFSNPVFDGIYYYIHSFRMELFFFIAGLFYASMAKRKGISSFVKNRIDRILIPFFFCLLLIAPLSMIPFRFISYYTDHQELPVRIVITITTNTFLKWNGLVHFWFLYYLIFYYGISILLNKLIQALSERGKLPSTFRISEIYSKVPKGVITIFLVWVILLLFSADIPFKTSTSIVPPPVNFLYYLVFFFWGALESISNKGLVKGSYQNGLLFLGGWGIITTAGFWLYYNIGNPGYSNFPIRLLAALLQAASAVFAITGLVKLSGMFFHSEIKVIRFISDSSYWMYIIHVLLVVLLQLLFIIHPRILPNILKYPAILLITIGMSLITYSLFVRYTIIGEYLHGRKYPSLPAPK